MRANDCDHCGEASRSHDLAVARQAMADDDPKHAAYHAASALSFDPDDPEALRLVDGLVAWRPTPSAFQRLIGLFHSEELLPRAPAFPADGWWGNHLVRARAAWLEGARADAFKVLVQVAITATHLDLSNWWNKLLDECEANGERVPVQVMFNAFALGNPTIGILVLRPSQQVFFTRWATLAMRLERHADAESLPLLTMCASAFLRRAGRFEEAAELATRALARTTDPHTRVNLQVQRGLALRGCGRWDDAIAAFAADLLSDNDHGVEIGRVHYDAGHVDDAIASFERYGTREDGEVQSMIALLRRRRGEPGEPWVARMIGILDAEVATPTLDDVRRLYVGHTDPPGDPGDATTNVLHQEKVPNLKGAQMTITDQEGPTARMVVALAASGRPDPREVGYNASAVPNPDPADPLDAAGGVRLWRRAADGVIVQAVPVPSAATRAALGGLARLELVTDRRWARARRLGPTIDADDVVNALVHPDPVPEGLGVTVPTWVFRWQLGACMLLAAADQRAWPASRRRLLLRSVLLSHPDWTTAAALYAALELALDEPETVSDIRNWCTWLSKRAPDKGHCPWAAALQRVCLVLPGMPPDLLSPVKVWLERSS